jgi:hypothetical protein
MKGGTDMKQKLLMIAFLIELLLVGTAIATPVQVDFTTLGSNFYDITKPGSYTIGEVTFSYENFGNTADSATIDSLGVWGTTGGSLSLDFARPAKTLGFDFSLPNVSNSYTEALYTVLSGLGVGPISASFIPYDPTDPASLGDARGTFSFTGASFNKADMYFTVEVPYFTVSNVSYEPEASPVPVPPGVLLLASGLLGMVGIRRFI